MKFKDFDFRIWDNINCYYLDKEKSYPIYLEITNIGEYRIFSKHDEKEKGISEDSLEVELFTEKYDCNNQKIFVGDLIEISNLNLSGIVEFRSGEFIIHVPKVHMFPLHTFRNECMVIIGNIH